MRTKLIGIGAAGNKAAIYAVENDIISIYNTMLINSTLKDIPADYQSKEGAQCYKFVNAYGGCGKERSKSYDLLVDTIEAGTIDLDSFLDIDTEVETELVIIVTSTEGGTGSGAAPLLARYIRQSKGISVHMFGITGFEDDVRGMRNTVDFAKELIPEITVEFIKNSKFLPACNNNKIKAEKEANKEFCRKISTLMGLQLRDSEHNIDPTDLLKLSTEEGYMVIESVIFSDKIKNAEQFKQTLINAIDNSKALDIDDPSMSKLGVMINIKEENTDYLEYDEILMDRFGVPYEKYVHIQHEADMPEFISFIAAGMKMPIEEIEHIYDNYKLSLQRVNKKDDDFFATIRGKQIDPTDKKFDLDSKKKKSVSSDDFLKAAKRGSFTSTTSKVDEAATDEY